MNEENVNYLKTQLKFMGFGDKLNQQLVDMIQANKPEFTLRANYEYKRPPTSPHEINEKDTVSYELFFKKGSEKEMYFFNKYEASLVKDITPAKEIGAKGAEMTELKNTFYIDKGKGVTAKEAYNLLDGRSVHKELTKKGTDETYNAWLKIDFNTKGENGNYKPAVFTDKYGFDVVKELEKLQAEKPFLEKKEDLLQSLKKGNVTPVSVIGEGGTVKFSIQANPQFHAIDVFDEKGKKQFVDRKVDQSIDSKPEQKTSNEKKNRVTADVSEDTKIQQKTTRRAGVKR